jgi:hypothetical protein
VNSSARRRVPAPTTNFATADHANLVEAKDNLQRAMARVRVLMDMGKITQDPNTKDGEGVVVWLCEGLPAKKAWGEYIRWSSDVDHWARRLADSKAQAVDVDAVHREVTAARSVEVQADYSRFLGERDAGSDDDEPGPESAAAPTADVPDPPPF